MLTPHAVDIAVIISSLIASLCFTFAELFDDISLRQVKLCIGQRKYKQKFTTQGRKDWPDRLTDRPSEWICARSLNSYYAFCKIVVKRKHSTWNFDRTQKSVCKHGTYNILCSLGFSSSPKLPLLLLLLNRNNSSAFFYFLEYNWTTHRLLTVQAGSFTVPRKFFDRGKSAPLLSVIIIKESWNAIVQKTK